MVVPPDGGWGWVIVAASFMCNLFVDGIIFSFGVFLNDISDAFAVSKARVALVGSLQSGFYLMAGQWQKRNINPPILERYSWKICFFYLHYILNHFFFLFLPCLIFKIFLKHNVFNYIVNIENIGDFFFFLEYFNIQYIFRRFIISMEIIVLF